MTTTSADPLDLQIARLEARQRELRDVYIDEVVEAPTVDLPPGMEFEALSTALRQLSQGVPAGADSNPVILECRRRVALMGALQAEHQQIKEKLEPLLLARQKRNAQRIKETEARGITPKEFAKGMACLLLIAGALVGAGAGIDALMGNRTFGFRHYGALATGYLVCLGVGEIRRIRRPGSKNKALEAGA